MKHYNQRKTKMTDLEKFIDLYSQFGIKCVVTRLLDGNQFITFQIPDANKTDPAVTYSHKFAGYENVYTDVIFNKKGEFSGQSFWLDID
jgi:hypothetical protein